MGGGGGGKQARDHGFPMLLLGRGRSFLGSFLLGGGEWAARQETISFPRLMCVREGLGKSPWVSRTRWGS